LLLTLFYLHSKQGLPKQTNAKINESEKKMSKSKNAAGSVLPNAATTASPETGAKATKKPRVAPEITAISAKVEMPASASSRRGTKSLYPFDDLVEVGQSFGVKNKTASDMSSIVSNQNRKNREDVFDENGDTVFETKTMKGEDGVEIQVPTKKPLQKVNKFFFVVDAEKNDPDGAKCRVFRKV